MRVLFLHPNFPGQFLRPADWAAQWGCEVKFLCQTHYGNFIPRVKRLTLKGDVSAESLHRKRLTGLAQTQALAEQYRIAMTELRASGWNPDVVISHSGWGCGLHTAMIWPKARRIAYVEWWFAVESPLYSFDPTNRWWPGLVYDLKLRERNMALAMELSEAHELITPTRWQSQQLPQSLGQRCQILPDGVDTNVFVPNPLIKPATPLLTYGTRGMEAMRGFPEFIEELPSVLEAHPTLNVEIAGEDRICYGGPPPKEGSYGTWAKTLLAPWIATKRVRFLDRLATKEYITWLQQSWMHVHLTRPFVSSWSLLEAMSAGCCLIASNTEPVREFVDPESAELVDFRHKGWLNPAVTKLLRDKELSISISANAREKAEFFDSNNAKENWELLLCAGSWT